MWNLLSARTSRLSKTTSNRADHRQCLCQIISDNIMIINIKWFCNNPHWKPQAKAKSLWFTHRRQGMLRLKEDCSGSSWHLKQMSLCCCVEMCIHYKCLYDLGFSLSYYSQFVPLFLLLFIKYNDISKPMQPAIPDTSPPLPCIIFHLGHPLSHSGLFWDWFLCHGILASNL